METISSAQRGSKHLKMLLAASFERVKTCSRLKIQKKVPTFLPAAKYRFSGKSPAEAVHLVDRRVY